MQPKVLGGGSVFNSAICIRMPEFALKRWQKDHGITVSHDELARHFESVESFMGVRPTRPDVQGRRNELFAEACAKVGISCEAIPRNEDGCRGSGECLTGCPNHGKLSMDRRGIPEVVERGGDVYTCVNVEKLVIKDGRVTGAVGWVTAPVTNERGVDVKITARHAVVLSAGALASPVIALRSGLTQGPIGANLRFHPSTAMMGMFAEEVHPWSGAAQGMHSLEYIEQGVKLESLWAAGSLLSFRLPGVGTEFQQLLADQKYMACWDAWASGEDSVGRVRLAPGTQSPLIRYDVGDGDMERLKFAMVKLSEMFFAVGAKRVLHGITGLKPAFENPGDVDLLRNLKMSPRTMLVGSNHVFGGMSMGADPKRHAVDNRGAVYGVRDLYVADTGLFPSSPAVNPMLTAMALADRIGQQMGERYA
jgi:choline dehydrogenase-like flavoprotein